MAKRKQAADAATNAPEAIDAAADQGITDAQQPTETTEGQPEEQGGARKPFVGRLPDPHGRHMIDIGDGRKMRLFLNRKFNQNAIQFTAPEGENSKPAPEDIGFLKDHGFQWRNDERVWTKQLARNTDENRYARGDSDKEAEDEFVELANRIRARKGMQPVEYSFSEQRAGGADSRHAARDPIAGTRACGDPPR